MNPNFNTFQIGRLALIATTVAISFTACAPEEDVTPPDTSGGTPTPQINEGYGTFVAAETVTIVNPGFGVPPQEVPYGIGVAVFFNGTDYTSYVNGGTVSVEGEELSRFDNGTYSTYSQTSVTGIEYSGAPNWVTTGAGDIPAITHTASNGFPSVGAISSSETVVKANGYTVTFDGGISNADSVIWVVGSKQFSTTGVQNSRTFTAAELSDLTTGAGNIIQVAAYNIESAVFGGKLFFFVNEKVVTKTVTVE